MKAHELYLRMENSKGSLDEWFRIFSDLANLIAESETQARKLLLIVLENRKELPSSCEQIFSTLISRVGLYPYLNGFQKDVYQELNFEFHRSDNLNEIVFHSEQLKLALSLNKGTSLVLSAPTSFGKSLLIQEIVASNKYINIVIIEPTLALVDEMREKLKKISKGYKIIFSRTQDCGDKNIFLFTQERLLEFSSLPKIDFFVIDEFYKLSFEQDERSAVLNHAFYYLLKQTNKFYLLGPKIQNIPDSFIEKNICEFYKTDFETVNVTRTYLKKDRTTKNLNLLLNDLNEPTLIYLRGPGSSERQAIAFAENIKTIDFEIYHTDIAEWIRKNINDSWSLINLLNKGIGFHHGELPRHIGKYIVNSFNSGKLKYLFCTSTLIEGVNTSAKNVVVYDTLKGKSKLTSFDLNNISGRAGRMGSYFSGNVFIFGDEIINQETDVDFPWLTQQNASDELLVQLDSADLKPESQLRVSGLVQNRELSFETIRRNSNVNPAGQIELAKFLSVNLNNNYDLLNWSSYPNSRQLKFACEMIWKYFVPSKQGTNEIDGVLSGSQLAFFIGQFQRTKSIRELIAIKILKDNKPVDQAVRQATKFQKKWIEFRFPKLLIAFHNIQEEICLSNGRVSGNYKFFASDIEAGFLPQSFSSLTELGLQYELIKQLHSQLHGEFKDVDKVISEIKSKYARLNLSAYERSILQQLIRV